MDPPALPAVVQMPPAESARVFLSARWHALAMVNYEIDREVLQPLVPRGTVLDSHDGKTYVSLVGFRFLGTRVLGLRIPLHRNFEEVNLRFYVRREVAGSRPTSQVQRAVAFVKEIVPRWAIATTARLTYNEPYLALPMRHAVSGPVADFVTSSAGSTPRQPFPAEAAFDSARGRVRYEWRFRGRWNSLSLWHEGRPAPLADCSLEQFIAEHYWGYCAQRDGGTVEYRVVHPPWQVWRGIDAAIDCDIAALYGPQFVSALSRPPASALLADGSEVAVLRPTRIA